MDKSTLNQPIVDYITRTCQINADLKWHFSSELLKIDNTKLLQGLSISNRGVATLSSLRETSWSPPSPKMYRKPNVLKGKSKKEKKRSSTNSSFSVPPKDKIQFHPDKTTAMLQNTPSPSSR